MLYAWRRVGHGSGRIAISIVADRLLGLFALLFILVLLTLWNWPTIRQVPALAALATSVFVGFGAAIFGAGTILAAPGLAYRLRRRLARWPRLAKLVGQIYDVIIMGRRNPARLAAAVALALIVQVCTVMAVVLIAQVMKIGVLAPIDIAFATPLTLIANTLPLTPNGLGVGEVAFEQICRWLEPTPAGAAYSSIFFAFRAVGALVSLSGIVSFGIYRRPLPNDVAA
jgi:glycosyltransferase 2 family protein